ncbi:uncharacterized protein si:rp71-46j2.7 isoform X1 [Pygocentrus nattereri]|uniref:uncharacterized protein si:rp71-46j2.7 isoform X1 n=1 Tax=Pygocentrus nattereri TaxID=42514 RepID=UPI000814AE14|nr:uncharacterized protein si:rp71-46j2.7 isoform X1 [Pygocentrus nattereri]
MRFWHYLFATLLSVIWCWSESGQFSFQAGIWLLCFLLIFTAACNSSERGTQTDGAAEEASPQTSENGHMVGRDETDTTALEQTTLNRSQYPDVQRSLYQLFRCAYAQLVLPWYEVPELGDSQPLYAALLREFNLIVDQIICKAKDFDLSVTSVGCIAIFTQHLHCAKQSDRSPLFISKAEEMAVLRSLSEALIRNLFPPHLWEPNVYSCALREILATKVLALVTLLSDPDNLNRLVVSQLDRVPSQSPGERGHDSDRENTTSSTGVENIEVPEEEVEESPSEDIKAKKKVGNKVMEKVSKLFKPKKKKIKKQEKELMKRALHSRRAAVIEADGASSCDDSVHESEDSDVESDLISLPEDMLEFKLSFEMWRVGNWQVTVTEVETEDDALCFTIRLEEKNNPENLHWVVKKTQSEIVEFYNHCRDMSHLPSISEIVEYTETKFAEDYQEEAKTIFEHFLQVLVEDAELGHTKLVFRFLCPLNRLLGEEDGDGGVWGLLGGIASFLNLSQEDDEPNNLKGEEKPHDTRDRCSISDASSQHDELAHAQPEYKHILQRQYTEMEEELLVTGSGYSPSSDQIDDLKYGKQDAECSDCLFNEPDQRTLSKRESVGENLAQFAARTKVIPKIQPAVCSSFDSDGESLGQYENDSLSDCHLTESINKKEHLTHKKSTDKPKGKEKVCPTKEETRSFPQVQKKTINTPNWEQPEVNKVIFNLLKEISGNSRMLKIIKTALTPFMPLIKKKVNTFLKKLNPSEAQVANYIDQLRELIWPEMPGSQDPPRSSEDKNKTKEKAMYLISSKFAGYIFSKTDMETLFKILQDTEENKKLVYMLLLYVLKRFLPADRILYGLSTLNGKYNV